MKIWRTCICFTLALILWVFFYDELVQVMQQWLPIRGKLLMRTPLYELAFQHMLLAGLTTAMSLITALTMAVMVRISSNPELESSLLSLATMGQSLPSAVIIALAVPVLGYGNGPVALALYLYGILPILRNAIAGFRMLPSAVVQAAKGMGMSGIQSLWYVDLPLIWPLVVAGLRTALVVNISAATIGATVGAGGLGVPIMAGIRTRDFILLFQGSGAVLLMALWADSLLNTWQHRRSY